MARTRTSRPPAAHQDFIVRFPKLGQAWGLVAEAGQEGPLDAHVARLIKLGIAVGAMREGAIHAAVRKAIDVGASPQEIEQVVALAAGTLGFPATVAVHSWARDILDRIPTKTRRKGTPRHLKR